MPSSRGLRSFISLAARAFSTYPLRHPHQMPSAIIQPTAPHTATVIFAHGLGDEGESWRAAISGDYDSRKPGELTIPARLPHVKWVFPDAPQQPVTANFGARMPSWFDLFNIPLEPGQMLDKVFEDDESMRNSVQIVDDLIQAEVKAGTPESRIVVGGFSQGGALALTTGLGGKEWRTKSSADGSKLAGVAVLSGWMPLKDKFQSRIAPHAKSVPVFWGHGTSDAVVYYRLAELSVEFLVGQLGITKHSAHDKVGAPGINFESYEWMGHASCKKEMEDLATFLESVIPREQT
ncbi:Phospholipase/carboxylesterase/thioesterase [Suillus paluster]|uniref:Phospholipase/carboxylesterase/thioesterase n=1 Tax=Suillus paluster TaxID=48578 RepID=UPI001B86F26C|nr:Phospholipase/carboxylesterase/thioesterase [Suillus paluster]KAG1752476.1 Phospholipase/carboxylesterase/thioesterase [Suillus paluster]